MHIPPAYNIIPEILEYIAKIEAQRMFFSTLSLPPQIKQKVQRVSLLKSSLFSARIEGNTLELVDLAFGTPEEEKKREVFNIVAAVDFIDSKFEEKLITKELLLHLHQLVLKDIRGDAGYIRTEMSAIFNLAGVAVYMPPPPSEISSLLDKLLFYSNSDEEKFPLVAAFISHLIFEKIHPFLDGNGRVGRLLIVANLKAKGWHFTFTIPFEEYLDNHKVEYYFHLDKGMKNTNDYLIFMLHAFLSQIEELRKDIEAELTKKTSPFLPPRQEEIYNIIKDHTVVSFDMIRRRFLSVPPRTLRYDLKKLTDQGFIEKAGATKGSYYRIKPHESLV